MMHNPPHPASLLREDVLPELGLTVTQFAAHLGMSRVALSRVLNEHAAISPDLAIRLEKAGLSRAQVWLEMQMRYDLWHAMQREQPPIGRLVA